MEFLDPEEKRARTYKLFMGYVIAAMIILGGTLVLSFVLQGVDIFNAQSNTRNGLLFVDSKPVSADISLDGNTSKKTDARFVLPEGQYNLKLTREGFREWQKDITVYGSRVVYHVYPRLFPNDIRRGVTAVYDKEPLLFTQSPDRRWILIASSNNPGSIEVYNTSRVDNPPELISMPPNVLSAEEYTTTRLETIEWSTDNKHVLLQKITNGLKGDYVVVSRDRPLESFNLSQSTGIKPENKVMLRDKKYNQYYVLDTASGTLKRASTSTGIESLVIADGVVDFKPYEDDTVLYATTIGAVSEGYISIRLLVGSNTYLLQPVVAADGVLLDIARFKNDWYFVASSINQDYAAIYINPLSRALRPQDGGLIKPQLRLILDNPKKVGFSDNARFIGLQSENSFTVYDGELKLIYKYDSPVELPNGGAKWMDGHRWHVISGSNETVFEFDGENKQTLVPAQDGSTAFYDTDYVLIYNLVKQQDGKSALQISRLTID
jgi:WD40 repeat protein